VIRPFLEEDFDTIWPIFESIVTKSETCAYDPQTRGENLSTTGKLRRDRAIIDLYKIKKRP
jgi:hypothetical protein